MSGPGGAGPSAEPPAVGSLDYALFVLRAARRHVWLCLATGLSVAFIGGTVAMAIPKIYSATSKVFLQPSSALTAALTGGHRLAEANEKPKSIHGEVALNRENLLSLVREAALLRRWNQTRSWPLRLKDRLSARAFGRPSVADQERALVRVLEGTIAVQMEDQGSIRFTAQWRDPEGAYLLTSLVQRNYFKDWQAEELAAITRATSLLQDEIQRTDDEVAPAIKTVQDAAARVRARNAAAAPPERERVSVRPAAVSVLPPTAATVQPNPRRTAETMQRLDELRRAEREILEPWQRRSAELKYQLADLRGTYGPEHPLVRQQEAKVQGSSHEPAELAVLKAKEAELLAILATAGLESDAAPRGMPALAAPNAAGGSSVVQYASLRSLMEREQDDPEVSSARIHLESVLNKSRELQTRLDAARMELASAQVSFKYRYKVVEPAEIPLKPIKPNLLKLYGGVLALAFALGLLAGAARELLRGRVLEVWQVRRLGIPVLAEVELPNLRLPRS